MIDSKVVKTESIFAYQDSYEVALYKDIYVADGLISSLSTTQRGIESIAEIFALENGVENSLMVNHQKSIVGALDANVFMVKGNKVTTPSVLEGAKKFRFPRKIDFNFGC